MLKKLHKFRSRVSAQRPREDVMVEDKVTLDDCEMFGPIQVGYRSYANASLLRNVTIGRFCSIGRRCSIGAARHDLAGFSTHPATAGEAFVCDPPTAIGNDVWIGDNAVVVAGLTIGDGAVIGAGAIVTRDVPPYAVVAGVPARLLRGRFPDDEIAALLESQWWRFADEAVSLAGPGATPRQLLDALARATPTPHPAAFRPWTPR